MSAYPDAGELMAGPLGQWLESQANVRENAKAKANNRLYKCALFGLPILAFFVILVPAGLELKLWVSAATGGIAFWWSQIPKREAIKAVKIGINDAIAGALGLKYSHDLEPGRGFEQAKSYRMLPKHHRSNFEDGWSGHYNGRYFVLHEAHCEERRGSGKNRRWVTVFRGAIITIGLAKDAYGTTLVQRAGKHRRFFGGVKDEVELGGGVLEYVDMVHPDFEDIFDIFSNDQVEARYLVHPTYVERLIKIEQAFNGDDVCCLFDGSELVVVINSGNMFESGSINAEDDRYRLERTIDQFSTLADLAKSLNEPGRGQSEASA